MQITVKETEMLKAFVNEAQLQTGATTAEEVLEDNMSFMNAVDLLQEVGGSLQSVGGVMASLAAKGFIVDTGEHEGRELHRLVGDVRWHQVPLQPGGLILPIPPTGLPPSRGAGHRR